MHTWDLSRASGQEADLDPAFCTELLAGMAPMEDLMRSSGQYGPRVPVPDRASRRTGWRASSAGTRTGPRPAPRRVPDGRALPPRVRCQPTQELRRPPHLVPDAVHSVARAWRAGPAGRVPAGAPRG
jgi:hypothetical protein